MQNDLSGIMDSLGLQQPRCSGFMGGIQGLGPIGHANPQQFMQQELVQRHQQLLADAFAMQQRTMANQEYSPLVAIYRLNMQQSQSHGGQELSNLRSIPSASPPVESKPVRKKKPGFWRRFVTRIRWAFKSNMIGRDLDYYEPFSDASIWPIVR